MGEKNFSLFNPTVRPQSIHITPAKLDVLDYMQDFDVTPSSYVHAQFGHRKFTEAVLTEFGKAHLTEFAPGYEHFNARYRVYPLALTDLARRALENAGRLRRRVALNDHFKHRYLRSVIQHSFTQSPREIPQLALSTEADILAHDDCPVQTRAAENPSWFQIGAHTVRPDHSIFGLTYTFGGHSAFMWFHGFEADRATERNKSDTYDKKTIAKSFEQYAEYVRQRLYGNYGFNDLLPFFPVVTIGTGRMTNMIGILTDVVPEEVIRRRFLFKALPNFLAYDPLPPPTAWAVTEPWQRVDGQFSIIETLKSVALKKSKEVI
jgi:hypothetical protein